jgi:metal-responsive CopG/Arc/MetJ family transcriptional regulator
MNVRTNLMLPADLVKAIDELAGPRGRSRYVADAMARQVMRDRQKEALEETFGTLSTDDYPHWSTPDAVVEWVRQRRSEQTDPGNGGP